MNGKELSMNSAWAEIEQFTLSALANKGLHIMEWTQNSFYQAHANASADISTNASPDNQPGSGVSHKMTVDPVVSQLNDR